MGGRQCRHGAALRRAWRSVSTGIDNDLLTIWGTSDSDFWVAGTGGTMLHHTGSGFAAATTGVTVSLPRDVGQQRQRYLGSRHQQHHALRRQPVDGAQPAAGPRPASGGLGQQQQGRVGRRQQRRSGALQRQRVEPEPTSDLGHAVRHPAAPPTMLGRLRRAASSSTSMARPGSQCRRAPPPT